MRDSRGPCVFLTHTPSDLAAFFPKAPLDRLREVAVVRCNPHRHHLAPRALDEHAGDVHYLITEWNTGADDVYFRKNDSLVAVVRVGVEILNVDLGAATENGVLVVNLPGIHQAPVIELTLAFILMLTRRIPLFEGQLRSGDIALSYNVALARGMPSIAPGYGLEDATVGLVGLGHIGAGVARLLDVMGAQVLAFDPYSDVAPDEVTMVGLDELLERSHVVSLHAKLTPESRHMIGRRELSLMRPGAYLVNTARGELVDSDALADALDAGGIAGAALDVFEGEPELAGQRLLAAKNCIVTPHMSGHTPTTFLRLADAAVLAVERMIGGEVPTGVVNPEVLQQPNCRVLKRERGRERP